MLISWNWLKDYVSLKMPREELERRLMMAGLNHEETRAVGDDWAIDLEVTSNRPDCLGHVGIARETAVLFGLPLRIPPARPKENPSLPVERLVKVGIECPDLCLHYTARVVRGVRIGPSPEWMVRRLAAVGIAAINNVVDISNYVMLECGQPLHTFDFGKLSGGEIIVRRPKPGETIEAIDHKTYELGAEMCMICDARRPVAIGGVMGGAQTEISAQTRDVLVEAAEFDPVSIRTTARQLNLHSDSSYRFERRVDPEGLDWASRRCCELILELAGGELAAGAVDVGRTPPARAPIALRLSQIKRILGIDVLEERVREILLALGNIEVAQPSPPAPLPKGEGSLSPLSTLHSSLSFVPPSWRRDLAREIDLIEEVGRIHGYDAIPEDVGVPMVPSVRRRDDRVLEKVRRALCAAGFDEAMTLSAVDEQLSEAFSPWTDSAALQSRMPVIRGADRLRRSLVPSLLGARRTNQSLANPEIELFEIAKIYLPRPGELPREELMLSLCSGRDFSAVKGAIESILDELKIADPLEAEPTDEKLFDTNAACRLQFRGETFGYLGALGADILKRFDLRGGCTAAEIRLAPLVEAAELVPRCSPQSPYPAISRDVNLVVDESVRWAELAAVVRESAGACFESLEFRDDRFQPSPGKKSLLFTVVLRSADDTLTGQQADEVRGRIVSAAQAKFGAELRA